MATYAIGDVQGCFAPLERLLASIQFDSLRDTLWFTGDLVNRGPDSLAVLRFVKSLGAPHQTILGNHDLHLLAVFYGASKLRDGDTLQEVLDAPDSEELMDWLRSQPLLVHDPALNYALVHAGIAPNWSMADALSRAREVEQVLQGPSPQDFLQHMYGNTPDQWNEALVGVDRLRCIVNYFTRMRLCHADGRLDLQYKGTLQDKPQALMPWFAVPDRQNTEVNIVFGHWAALGANADVPRVYPLDTGCVWGNCLTAMRLEDGWRVSVSCAK